MKLYFCIIVAVASHFVSMSSCDQVTPPPRHCHNLRNSAAHEWTCSFIRDTLPRMSVFVITGSNVIDTRGKAVRDTWGAAFPASRLFFLRMALFLTLAPTLSRCQRHPTLTKALKKSGRLRLNIFCQVGDNNAVQNIRAATDWPLVADDDTYVFVINLISALVPFSMEWPYAMGRMQLADGVYYPSGGAGYILSRAAIGRICDSIDTFIPRHWRSYYSDINLGDYLSSLKIATISMDGFYPSFGLKDPVRNPRGMRFAPDSSGEKDVMEMDIARPLTYHYVSPEQMTSLHANSSTQIMLRSCKFQGQASG